MIKVEHKSELIGADKYGECSNCGTTDEVAKITFNREDNTQQHSFRLCKECSQELVNVLISAGMVK